MLVVAAGVAVVAKFGAAGIAAAAAAAVVVLHPPCQNRTEQPEAAVTSFQGGP